MGAGGDNQPLGAIELLPMRADPRDASPAGAGAWVEAAACGDDAEDVVINDYEDEENAPLVRPAHDSDRDVEPANVGDAAARRKASGPARTDGMGWSEGGDGVAGWLPWTWFHTGLSDQARGVVLYTAGVTASSLTALSARLMVWTDPLPLSHQRAPP